MGLLLVVMVGVHLGGMGCTACWEFCRGARLGGSGLVDVCGSLVGVVVDRGEEGGLANTGQEAVMEQPGARAAGTGMDGGNNNNNNP